MYVQQPADSTDLTHWVATEKSHAASISMLTHMEIPFKALTLAGQRQLGRPKTWKSLLEAVVRESGGIVDQAQSLIEGKWDASLIRNFQTKVNWHYAD